MAQRKSGSKKTTPARKTSTKATARKSAKKPVATSRSKPATQKTARVSRTARVAKATAAQVPVAAAKGTVAAPTQSTAAHTIFIPFASAASPATDSVPLGSEVRALSDHPNRPQYELQALRTYVMYYHMSSRHEMPTTAFSPWRSFVWANSPPSDPGVVMNYYRTVANSAAVAAMVKQLDPENPHCDIPRAVALLMAVLNEYTAFELNGQPKIGWGRTQGEALGFLNESPGGPCIIAAALLWRFLDPGQRQIVRNVIADLANRVVAQRSVAFYSQFHFGPDPNTNYISDTKAEEASISGSFLALASQFYRSHPNSGQWLSRANELMRWSFDVYEQADADYLVANHGMRFSPSYGISALNEAARAILPWAGQGISLTRTTGLPPGIPPIAGANANLYGADVMRFFELMRSQVNYIHGVTRSNYGVPIIPPWSDLSFQGVTLQSTNMSNVIDFRQRAYMGVSGVSDFGTGADFQNGAFALGAWIDVTVFPSPGTPDANYATILRSQSMDAGYGYLQTVFSGGCDNASVPADGNPAGWTWGFLPASCPAPNAGRLVPFFPDGTGYSGTPHLTRANQINTHFFLNSLSAINHVVGYIYARGIDGRPFWPVGADGQSTLPDFGV